MLTSSIVAFGTVVDPNNPFGDEEPGPIRPSTPVVCTSAGCRAAGVELMQITLNLFARKYGFSPVDVDGVVGPATTIAMQKVGVGQQYHTFQDVALNATSIHNELLNKLTTSSGPPMWIWYALGGAFLVGVGMMYLGTRGEG